MAYTFTEVEHSYENVPVWCTISYEPYGDAELVTWLMYKSDELVGRAVIHKNFNDMGLQDVSYIGSFQVKDKGQGHGSRFLQHLKKIYKPLYLAAINETGPFYYINGANIIRGDLYDHCLMAFGIGNQFNGYVRRMCKECQMLHTLEYPDECMTDHTWLY